MNVVLGAQLGGAPQGWAWTWGDGATSDIEMPGAHTYTSAGTYTITLVETNPAGSSTHSHQVTVSAASTEPVAAFYGTVPSPCVDLGAPLSEACGGSTGSNIYYRFNPSTTVDFTDQSTNATGATYAWDFGDPSSGSNNTSTSQNPSHAYATPGSFTVTLTVTTAGGSNEAQRISYVNLGCIIPSFIGKQTGVGGPNSLTSLWTAANFAAGNLYFWQSDGSYTTTEPTGSSKYTVQQQNPQGSAFFAAIPSGSGYACTTSERVAPAGAVPAP